MKNITFTLLFLGIGALPAMVSAEETLSADDNKTAVESQSSNDESSEQLGKAAQADNSERTEQPESSEQTEQTEENSNQENINRAQDAGERRTPPWTNDSANTNLQQPRTPADENKAEPYTAEDFTVKPEWEKLFADHNRFSTTTGEELYHTMCQACHMEDGQGASGAGDYPSFVGDERLRSRYYPIDVTLNGFRGMPAFKDMLSNQQIADVVNYLRANFGNQLEGDATADDVERVRH